MNLDNPMMKVILGLIFLGCCLACTSYKSIAKKNEGITEALIRASMKPGGKYKLTLQDGHQLKVKLQEVDSVSVHGSYLDHSGEVVRRHAFHDTYKNLEFNTTKISARKFDILKTMGLLLFFYCVGYFIMLTNM